MSTTTYCRPCDAHHDEHGLPAGISPECLDFAPITLNGEPVITWANDVQIDGRFYAADAAASEDCYCRRCLLHEDFGGCIVGWVLWELCCLLACVHSG